MNEIIYGSPAEVFIGIGLMILLVALAVCIASAFEKRKTKSYRQEIADMYVAAKTRFLAKEDGLDLEAEHETFKKWSKKKKQENPSYELDNAIEEDLMDKVSETKPTKK